MIQVRLHSTGNHTRYLVYVRTLEGKCAILQVEQGFLGVNGGYVTYRVATSTSLPNFSRPDVAVRRRFRDFVVRAPHLC